MKIVQGVKVITEELGNYFKQSITFVDEDSIQLLKYNKITAFTSTTIVELSKLNLDLNQYKMFLKRNKIQNIWGIFIINQFTKETIQLVKNAILKYHLSQILLLSEYPSQFYKNEYQFKSIEKDIATYIHENIKNIELYVKIDLNFSKIIIKHNIFNYLALNEKFFLIPSSKLFPYFKEISDQEYLKLAHSLRNMFHLLEYEVEIFSIGNTSNLVAEHLQELLSENKFETQTNISLILIDRTLDLVSPLLHSDHYIDKEKYLNEENDFKYVFKHSKELLSYIRQELIKKQNQNFNMKELTGLDTVKQIDLLLSKLDYEPNYEIIEFTKHVLSILEKIQNSDYNEWVEIEKLILTSNDIDQSIFKSKEMMNQLMILIHSLYPGYKNNSNEKIEFIKKQKSKFEKFKSLIQNDYYTSLLKQLIQSILNNDDITDLKKSNSLFRSIFTNSFFKSKTNISSNSEYIIFYIIGGISISEIQEIFDSSDSRFIIGSNTITNPKEIVEKFNEK